MACRTGKTCTFIEGAIDADTREIECPTLVLGPLTVLPGWINEFTAMGFNRDDIVLVRGNAQQRRNLLRSPSYKIFLLNYDVCERDDVLNVRKVAGITDWKCIAFDESRCLSNPDSNRTAYWLGGKPARKHRYDRPMPAGLPIPAYQRRVALSGLPAPESPKEYAAQYFIIDGSFMGYWNFDQYLKENWRYNKWDYEWQPVHPYHIVRIGEYVQQHSYCVTMEEADPNYKGLFFNIWDIPMTAQQKQLYEWLQDATTYIYPGEDPKTDTKLFIGAVKFSFGMSIAAGIHPLTEERIKCDKYTYIVEWYKLKKEPVVILSQSLRALKFLASDLDEAGITHRMVHGDTSIEDRETYRQEFQDGIVDMFLAQSLVVHMGFNLSRADVIMYLTNDPSNNVRSQANQRATVVGKERPVSIVDLCIEDTRERDLVPLLSAKFKDATAFISENVSFWKKQLTGD